MSVISSIKNKWGSLPLEAKVSSAYVMCSMTQQCLSLLTMPIFARMLTEEQYGQFVVYSSWIGILSIFITLNLAYGSFSKAMIKFEKDREGYIASVESIAVTFAMAFLVLYLPLRKYWNMLFNLPTRIVCIMVAEILGTMAILLWSGKKRFEFRYKSVVVVTLIMAFTSPVLTYLMVINTEEKGFARILGYAYVNILMGGFFLVFNFFRGKKLFNKEYWQYGLRFNIPLLAYYLSQVIFNQSDRIMIDHMIGTDKAAVYGVAYTLANVLIFVLNAINNAYVPWFYIKLKEGNPKENRKITLIIAGLMAVLLSGVIWMAPEIILFVSGAAYAEAANVVPPVAVSLLLLFFSQLFINVEFFYEKKKHLVYASIGAALINLALNWFFIPRFGFVAAAYTTLASYVVFAVANYIAMKSVLATNNVEDNAYNYKGLLTILGIFVICSALGASLYGYFWIRVAVVLVVWLVLFIKRDMLQQYVDMIIKKGNGSK